MFCPKHGKWIWKLHVISYKVKTFPIDFQWLTANMFSAYNAYNNRELVRKHGSFVIFNKLINSHLPDPLCIVTFTLLVCGVWYLTIHLIFQDKIHLIALMVTIITDYICVHEFLLCPMFALCLPIYTFHVCHAVTMTTIRH